MRSGIMGILYAPILPDYYSYTETIKNWAPAFWGFFCGPDLLIIDPEILSNDVDLAYAMDLAAATLSNNFIEKEYATQEGRRGKLKNISAKIIVLNMNNHDSTNYAYAISHYKAIIRTFRNLEFKNHACKEPFLEQMNFIEKSHL